MKITSKTKISELMKYPELLEELFGMGMHCVGCPMAMQETIGEAAKAHGIKIKELIKKLNDKLNK